MASMKNLIISAAVLLKLREKHSVSRREVEQCFENKCGSYIADDREEHRTDPATLWFIAPTNRDRMLKVVFIYLDGNVHLKSAYEADPDEIALYDQLGK